MRAAAFAKITPESLTPDHPWSFSGKTAELLQMTVESMDPIKAAEWRSAAGGTISLATQAEELDLQPHSKTTKKDLYRHNPIAVQQELARQQQWEKDQLADMQEKVNKIQTAKYGKPLDLNEPNFGGGWQCEAMRRQYELDQAMGRSWN